MEHVAMLSEYVGVQCACENLGMGRSTYYARKRPRVQREKRHRPTPQRALSKDERERVVTVATSEEYVDKSPAAIVTNQLDKGIYLCSERTLYRLLHANAMARERRSVATHPEYSKPELMATGPCEVWTWDITKLKGPQKGVLYSLYVVLDMFSRYIVGWTLATCENAFTARELIDACCEREGIEDGQLTIHADNGGVMRSNTLAEFLDMLGVRRSHSRAYQSNDNPFIESQFRTMKYSAGYPKRFNSIEHARAFCREFIEEYNNHMYHSGIAMLTPAMVHHGYSKQIIEQRQITLEKAFAMHPERFVNGSPKHANVPAEVWINKPVIDRNVVVNS